MIAEDRNALTRLYMPEPHNLPDVCRALAQVDNEISEFIDSIKGESIEQVIKKMDQYISKAGQDVLLDPDRVDSYKNEQQRRCDEYFYISRTNDDLEKRFIVNTFIIARDVLVNNQIDDYLDQNEVNAILKAMSNFLSYNLTKGELK